jgi:hypothetical protein
MISLIDRDELGQTESRRRHVPFGLRPMAPVVHQLHGRLWLQLDCVSIALLSQRMRRSMTRFGKIVPVVFLTGLTALRLDLGREH